MINLWRTSACRAPKRPRWGSISKVTVHFCTWFVRSSEEQQTSSVFLVCGTVATTIKENNSHIPWETPPMIQAQNCPSKILHQLLLSAKIARSINVSKVFNFYDFVKNWWVSRGEIEKYAIYASSIGKEMVIQHLSGMFDHGPLDQGQMQLQRNCSTCQALPC